MEDNNNKLGDFFRKGLSSLEGEDQDWFNPNPRTDNLIIKELSVASKKKRDKKRGLHLFLPCLLFLGMLAYILYLKHHIVVLNDSSTHKILVNTTPTATNNKDVAEPHNTTKENQELIINKRDAEYKKLQQILYHLTTQNEALQQTIRQKNRKIHALQIELNRNCSVPPLFASNIQQTKKSSPSGLFSNIHAQPILVEDGNSTQNSKLLLQDDQFDELPLPISSKKQTQSFQDLLVLRPGLLPIKSERIEPLDNTSFNLKNKKKRKLNSLEVGFQAGLYTMLTEKKISIMHQRIVTGNPTTERLVAPYLGVNIAYSPFKNLWIRAGIRGGGNTSSLKQNMGIVYDNGHEYTLPSGDIGNDFVLNTSTGYTDIKNTLTLIVPKTTANGDLFELKYYEELKTIHLQIPLTIEYFFGSRKWQPFVYSGLKWNIFQYEYKASDINLVSRDQPIIFDINKNQTNASTLQHVSFLTGAGLSCNIKPKLSLRTRVALEYNVSLEATTTDTDFSKSGLSADFGLYYKF